MSLILPSFLTFSLKPGPLDKPFLPPCGDRRTGKQCPEGRHRKTWQSELYISPEYGGNRGERHRPQSVSPSPRPDWDHHTFLRCLEAQFHTTQAAVARQC